jgi:hypothetical protein
VRIKVELKQEMIDSEYIMLGADIRMMLFRVGAMNRLALIPSDFQRDRMLDSIRGLKEALGIMEGRFSEKGG